MDIPTHFECSVSIEYRTKFRYRSVSNKTWYRTSTSWYCTKFQNSAQRASYWWTQELSDVQLKPLYDALGPDKTSSSTRVSCTYCCRHHWTQGKRKPTYFKMFLKAPDDVISARRGFEVGVYLSDQVAAMNSSGFQPYCCDSDAGKIAHTACTLPNQRLCTGHSCRIHYAGSCSPD